MNQSPEQLARDRIDAQLTACGWTLQNKSSINLHAAVGVAIREYGTGAGPADYVLFVDKKPVGIIEAKRAEEGVHLTVHEEQSKEYADSGLKYLNNDPLPFVYESTGDVVRFTDYRDPKPRSRNLFTFHRPETFRQWLKEAKTLRSRLHDLPALEQYPSPGGGGREGAGLRGCQIKAINKLEKSFKTAKPKALIQMATGSGKTFTAITFIYRLLKFSKAARVLFLVDTKNLGEQAEQEFMSFLPADDNRKFTELYGVHRLKSGYVPTDNQVYISTIQRMYSVLREKELGEREEEENPAEKWLPKEAVPVAYNAKLPVEFFDFIVIDECHRSIYNLWKQVLDYFDAFLIGLTATPDNRTFGFFHQNIVSEYTHEQAVADGVNVGHNVFQIETEVSKKGGVVWKGEYVDHREKLTRKKRWEQLDEDLAYTHKQLDDKIVNPNQIRLIIKTFKEHLPEIFPDRMNDKGEFEVPKTLIFAKTDSHADDIIQIVREEFGEENRFCKKITYNADDPKGTLAQFRNDYHPRIAVTVDMIATGTDVRPLECLLFMRDVRSKNYFDQMKGRGTRTVSLDDLRKVSPAAKYTKDHFVIVDAIGVTKSLKTETHSLEKCPGVPLKDLLGSVAVGVRAEELFTSLANRLARLDRQMGEKEREKFVEKAGGKTPSQVVKELLNAFNPDVLEGLRSNVEKEHPDTPPAVKEEKYEQLVSELQDGAATVFTGDLNAYIENVRKAHYQVIDALTQDKLTAVGWKEDNRAKAEEVVSGFRTWIAEHRDEITALQVFYNQPFRRRTLTYAMITDLLEKLKEDKPGLAPLAVWRAYEQLGPPAAASAKAGPVKAELIALVSLVRHVCGLDQTLTAYDKTVDRAFQQWILKKNAGQHNRFTEEQTAWLRMIKEHIASSFHLEREDLRYAPFDGKGGLGKMWQLFGEKTDEIINELNEELVA